MFAKGSRLFRAADSNLYYYLKEFIPIYGLFWNYPPVSPQIFTIHFTDSKPGVKMIRLYRLYRLYKKLSNEELSDYAKN